MQRAWTAEECLERACRLVRMADEASSYEQILTYDSLAQEWLELAARTSRPPSEVVVAPAPARKFKWREFLSWFR